MQISHAVTAFTVSYSNAKTKSAGTLKIEDLCLTTHPLSLLYKYPGVWGSAPRLKIMMSGANSLLILNMIVRPLKISGKNFRGHNTHIFSYHHYFSTSDKFRLPWMTVVIETPSVCGGQMIR